MRIAMAHRSQQRGLQDAFPDALLFCHGLDISWGLFSGKGGFGTFPIPSVSIFSNDGIQESFWFCFPMDRTGFSGFIDFIDFIDFTDFTDFTGFTGGFFDFTDSIEFIDFTGFTGFTREGISDPSGFSGKRCFNPFDSFRLNTPSKRCFVE